MSARGHGRNCGTPTSCSQAVRGYRVKKHKERRKVAQAQKRAVYQKRKAKRALKKIKKVDGPNKRTTYPTMKF